MELKISQKTEQPLFAREELHGIIGFDGATPSRAEVRKKLAESIKSDEGMVVVNLIDPDFGSKSAKLTAHVYKTKDDLEKYESKTTMYRHLTKEEKAKLKEAAKPKEAAA